MNDPWDQADYIQARRGLDKAVVALFPDRLPNNTLSFSFSSPHKDMPGKLYLKIRYFSEKKYFKDKAEYLNQASHRIASADTCLFLIDEMEGSNHDSCGDFYPIPAEAIFETASDGESKVRSTDSEVLFIQLKSGDFTDNDGRHSGRNLPANWTHGYSTGVTTNDLDKTIKIWTVVW